jgi:hypothetical protein
MKRTILLLVALSIASGAYAKNDRDRNEITITYGQITAPQFAYMFGGVLGAAFSLGHFSFDHALMFGAAGVEYVHYVNNWLGFGGMVLCDYMTADAYSVASDGTKTPDGKYNLGFASAMPVVKFAWLNREHVGLYSKLACGVGYVFADQSSDPARNFTWSGQVTPIGVDFGGMSFRGFVELGIGMQGLVSGGVRWLF